MRKGLWIMGVMAMGAVLFLATISQHLVVDVSGIEEAKTLQSILRGSFPQLLAPEPPLRVLRVPPSEAVKGFRWRVEATLRPGVDPKSSPVAGRLLDRMVARCLSTTVLQRPPAGVILVLHGADGAETRLDFDGQGRAVPPPAPPPAPPGGPR